MDILHDAQSMFFCALCNLLNIYCSETRFKQKLWREMKQHFYDQYSFSISVTGFEAVQQKGKNVPEILCCACFPACMK
jgi:hypothetical protein